MADGSDVHVTSLADNFFQYVLIVVDIGIVCASIANTIL